MPEGSTAWTTDAELLGLDKQPPAVDEGHRHDPRVLAQALHIVHRAYRPRVEGPGALLPTPPLFRVLRVRPS